MTARARAVGAVATAALGLLAWTATIAAVPAAAVAVGAVQTVVVGGDSEEVLLPLQVDRLYPGSATEARFVLRREEGLRGGAFAVEVRDVEDVERGCNRPERNAGDTTCGSGDDQGELSQQLLIAHSWSTSVDDCATAPRPTGGAPLRDAGPALAPADAEDRDAVCLVVGLTLPPAADNLVQTDQARFALQLGTRAGGGSITGGTLRAAGRAAPTEVEPTVLPGADLSGAGRDALRAPVQALAHQPAELPFTGTPAALLLCWAAACLTVGWALIQWLRRSSL